MQKIGFYPLYKENIALIFPHGKERNHKIANPGIPPHSPSPIHSQRDNHPLRREKVFFLKNGFECDFVTVSKAGGITYVIQVCSDLSDPGTLAREVKGIKTACKQSGVFRGTIIAYDQQDKIEEDGITIQFIPLPVFSHNIPAPDG
ncbi:MAG: hypothetical protein WBM69_01315 [Desulfobacterales bacterium]